MLPPGGSPTSHLAGGRRILRNYEFRYLDPEKTTVFPVALRRDGAMGADATVHHLQSAFLTTRLAKREEAHRPGASDAAFPPSTSSPRRRAPLSAPPPRQGDRSPRGPTSRALHPRPVRPTPDAGNDMDQGDEPEPATSVLLTFLCPHHAAREASFWQESLPAGVTSGSRTVAAPLLLRDARDIASLMRMPVAVLLNTRCSISTRQTHHDLALVVSRL